MDAKQTYYAGIDVSKEHLDVVLRPTGEYLSANNDERGIESLAAHLKEASPALVVVEAPGGLEQPVAAALAVGGLPVAVVNPSSLIGGRARRAFSWPGHHDFAEGEWVLLDLYGTNHDERRWEHPEAFRSERFRNWPGDPYTLVP